MSLFYIATMKKNNVNNSKDNYLESEEFLFYVLELEHQWKKSSPRLTDKEKVEIFQPAKEMLLKNISKLKKEYGEVKSEIKKDLKIVPEKDSWFYDILFEKLRMPELTKIENRIFQLKRQLVIVSPPARKSFSQYENFQEMIVIAKSRSIIELARDKLELIPSGENFRAICPFHSDTRPSLYFYSKTNTFICFSCNQSGDVIEFNQLINGVSFAESVRMLQ